MQSKDKGGPADLAPQDFEAIREAVMETPRGRWFLGEYASRLRSEQNSGLLDSMKRLEQAVTSNHDALMARLAEALANGASTPPPASAPQADLAPKHMKFFKQHEEIFEPAPQAKIAPVATPAPVKTESKPDVPKGAKVVIRRVGEAPAEVAPAATAPDAAPAPAPAPEPAAAVAEPIATLAPESAPATASAPVQAEAPKRRIVIIRHKPGEEIDVPLQNEMAEAS